MSSEYDSNSHWISRVIQFGVQAGAGHPLLSSVLTFGLVPDLCMLVLYSLKGDAISTTFWAAMASGITLVNVAPALVWYYDERVLPTFFEASEELVADEDRLRELAGRYNDFFASPHLLGQTLWTGSLLLLFVRSRSFLASQGLFTVGDGYFWFFLFIVIYVGALTAVGFLGVVTTVLLVREVAGMELQVNPRHPDGLGGLSPVGYFAIRTTLTFSSGSLLLPLTFIFIRSDRFPLLPYLIGFSFVGFVALSFLYPTFTINRRAQQMRERRLDALRNQYETARSESKSYDEIGDGEGTSELVKQLELQRIRNDFKDLKSVRLYPFQVDILVKLATSLLLPILFLCLEYFVFG